MDFAFKFSQDDYKQIAKELWTMMVAAQAQVAPAPVPAPVAPTPLVYPSIAPEPAPAPVAPAPVAPPVSQVTQVVAPVSPVAQQPAPALPTLSAVTYHQAPNGERRDDRCGPGTPGTVTLPLTRNTLSLPQADKEGWLGYVRRVSFQCGSDMEKSGEAMYRGDEHFAEYGGFKADGSNWAIGADKLYNPNAYADPRAAARQAAANAAMGWDGVPGHQNDPWIPKVQPVPLSSIEVPLVETNVPISS